ncbi:M15 family metallopeptidase [Moritella sp. F3]|uniref:M15 family metallopeptidase n=1 Tax=Moritella sp. F3 TaxID=2718882 RepID=UPI0018E0E717|nr:M15 family metallopeptidase [Moritella sp. F3]GIC76010.1 peptidase M15 [Moritella sp. F1]GIC81549.1 peptidase M15 [Moritella sp. F3]
MLANTLLTTDALTGQAQSHVTALPMSSVMSSAIASLAHKPQHLIHQQTLPAFQQLQTRAKQAGFNLDVVSCFRSFEQQLLIWNNKFNGLRPILDHDSQPLDTAILSEEQKVFAILRWSMLPGASRHHWGTEIDVCDYSALPAGYQLQLIPQEYDEGGYLAALSTWLDNNIADCGFYRPYRQDLGGVSREPWHLSYLPMATQAQQAHTLAVITDTIRNADIQGKATILANIEQIYRQYICNVAAAD